MQLPFRAVFFDFDGTLADSYPAITASVNHVRGAHGLAPLTVDGVKGFVGRGPEYLLEHTVPGCDVQQTLSMYRAHHPSVMYSGTTLLPKARETIEMFHRAGCQLAICSNKPRAFTHKLVEHLNLHTLISDIFGPEDVARPKPAPDMLLAGLKRLDVASADALYIGDMTVDIETARGAGVRVWIVPTGSDSREAIEKARPDRLLNGLEDLLSELNH